MLTLDEKNKSELIKPTLEGDRLNPVGLHLLYNYYLNAKSKKNDHLKMGYRCFVVNHVKDLPIILSCARSAGLITYGILMTIGGSHTIPVLIDNNHFHILESVGLDQNILDGWGLSCTTEACIAIRHFDKNASLHIYHDQRQFDLYSCATDAAIVLKESFKVLESYKAQTGVERELSSDSILYGDFTRKDDPFYITEPFKVTEHSNSPLQVAKYTQSLSMLKKIAGNEMEMPILIGKNGKEESINDYIHRHEKEIKIYSSQSREERLTISNGAMDDRRMKHARWIEQKVNTSSVDDLRHAMVVSSGLSLVIEHAHDIPEHLLDLTFTPKTVSQMIELEQLYIDAELQMQRVNVMGFKRFHPNPQSSLATIASYHKIGLLPDLQLILPEHDKLNCVRPALR